jgi:diguanylate cyclase (GGDEF)-like protein
MTALRRLSGDRRLLDSDLVRQLRSAPARLAASEFRTVGESRRFRAFERGRTRAASRAGFIVIALAVGLDATVLTGLEGDSVGVAIGLDALILVLTVGAWWLLPRGLRHHPELAAGVITLGVAISTVVTGGAVPSLAAESLSYLLVIPGLIALVVPWRTRTHLGWLACYSIIGIGYITLDPSGRFNADERGDLVVVLVVALGASLVGHLLLKRAQIRGFAQLQKIRHLHRQADVDMIELERAHHALELTARVDPLTGAGNRRRLEEDLRAVRAHINRSAMHYGVVAIDLDRFKAINDRSGHQAGDEVLRRVVGAIQQTLRAEDAVYRLGGEEFLVILNVPTTDGLLAAAERLRNTVTNLAIAHEENVPHGVVSISLGATLIGPDDLGLTDEQWLDRADQALYRAKAAGRNRVVCAPTDQAVSSEASSAA